MTPATLKKIRAALDAALAIPAGDAQWLDIATAIVEAHKAAKAAKRALDKEQSA